MKQTVYCDLLIYQQDAVLMMFLCSKEADAFVSYKVTFYHHLTWEYGEGLASPYKYFDHQNSYFTLGCQSVTGAVT